jgi:2-polyprenyl-6-methoxyphenol hydroxylase-like FAD-dependent oxidoreductase
MSETFDVVVVGARCAGSPLATLLARQGLRVALVERAKFPRDTLSSHIFEAPGINLLSRLGVLDKVRETSAEPVGRIDIRQDEFAARIAFPARPGDIGGIMSVRRFLLDPILADAATEAGAEVMMETNVTGLAQNGRATGVRVVSGGSERVLSARLVVGADGRNSTVARVTGARKYHVVPSERFVYWGFFEDADPGPEPEIVFHHNAVRSCLPVAQKVAGARRVGKLLGMVRWQSFFRESAGPGWALLGDAGQFKDPTPGQGMTDAFRQAEAMAAVIALAVERSDAELDGAMVEWARWRDRHAFEHHWMACDLGAAGRSPVLLPAMASRLERNGQLEPFLDLFQHRALPSRVFTPMRLLSTAARLLVRGDGPRADVLSEVGELIMTDARRKRLRRNPTTAIDGIYDTGVGWPTKRAVLKLYRASPASMMRGPIEELHELDRPALVLWGTDDAYLPWRLAERQRAAFPSARIELLEGLGHWPFHEDPTRVAELALPFLRAQTGIQAR